MLKSINKNIPAFTKIIVKMYANATVVTKQ